MHDTHFEPEGDGIHPVGWGDGHEIVPVIEPDFDAIDRHLSGESEGPEEGTVTFSEMVSAFVRVLDFICKNPQPGVVAGRALALQFWLHPEQSHYDSVAQIALSCGLTRQALSKAVLQFKDSLNIRFPVGKRNGTRDAFRAAQVKAMENGTHASYKRQARKQGCFR
jgi:hypothetical protein